MVYECEKCNTALPAGVLACPKCGEGFDEAVPHDAEVPKRGWYSKPVSEVSSSPPNETTSANAGGFTCSKCAARLVSGSKSCANCGLAFDNPVPFNPSITPNNTLIIPTQQTSEFISPATLSDQSFQLANIGFSPAVKQVLWGVCGTILAGLIGGKIYADQIADRTTNSIEFGAVIGFIGMALAFTIAAIKMRPFSLPHFRGMWVACAILYPICLYIGFNGTISATKNAFMSRFDDQQFQQQFRQQYGRDATSEEIDQLKQQASEVLSGGLDNSDMGQLEQGDLSHQIFWGPVLISMVAGGILFWQKQRFRIACTNCGNILSGNASFCSKCGQTVPPTTTVSV